MESQGFQILVIAVTLLAGVIAIFWKSNNTTRDDWLKQSLKDIKSQGAETKHEVKKVWPEINEINLKFAEKNAQCIQHETVIKNLTYDVGALEKSLITYHSRVKGTPVENFRNDKQQKENK